MELEKEQPKEPSLYDGMTKTLPVEKPKKEVSRNAALDTKIYHSLIVPDLEIDVANFITEIILTKKKRAMPSIAFWTKEWRDKYTKLVTEYVAELTQVKKLLKVFSPVVVIEYVKTCKYPTLRYLKAADQREVIFGLFSAQYKFIQSLDIEKTPMEKSNDKLKYIERETAKKETAFSKGL